MDTVATATFLDLCVDASSTSRLERFWAAVLGWEVVQKAEGNSYLAVAGSPTHLWVNEVPEPKTVKNRVHLDVYCRDVEEVLAHGAELVRPPTDTEPWWSLTGPDGDEICAFVRADVPANRLYEVVVDAADAVAVADWWADLLGGRATHEEHGSFVDRVQHLPCQYLVFQPVPEPKTTKNRVHWDVRADLAPVLDRGATLLREPVPGDTSWHVLADPEGNEFCVFPTV